jgi:hypothetical protein
MHDLAGLSQGRQLDHVDAIWKVGRVHLGGDGQCQARLADAADACERDERAVDQTDANFRAFPLAADEPGEWQRDASLVVQLNSADGTRARRLASSSRRRGQQQGSIVGASWSAATSLRTVCGYGAERAPCSRSAMPRALSPARSASSS